MNFAQESILEKILEKEQKINELKKKLLTSKELTSNISLIREMNINEDEKAELIRKTIIQYSSSPFFKKANFRENLEHFLFEDAVFYVAIPKDNFTYIEVGRKNRHINHPYPKNKPSLKLCWFIEEWNQYKEMENSGCKKDAKRKLKQIKKMYKDLFESKKIFSFKVIKEIEVLDFIKFIEGKIKIYEKDLDLYIKNFKSKDDLLKEENLFYNEIKEDLYLFEKGNWDIEFFRMNNK